MKAVLISGNENAVPAEYLKRIRDAGIELECRDCKSPDEVVAFAQDADLVWMFGPNCCLTGDALRRLPKCKAIFRSGSGIDALPCETAKELGVAVLNTPESISECVAEHAVSLLFAVIRRIPHYDRAVRAGNWELPNGMNWHISGRTLGIVGYGRIGRTVERMVFRTGKKRRTPTLEDDREFQPPRDLPGADDPLPQESVWYIRSFSSES